MHHVYARHECKKYNRSCHTQQLLGERRVLATGWPKQQFNLLLPACRTERSRACTQPEAKRYSITGRTVAFYSITPQQVVNFNSNWLQSTVVHELLHHLDDSPAMQWLMSVVEEAVVEINEAFRIWRLKWYQALEAENSSTWRESSQKKNWKEKRKKQL